MFVVAGVSGNTGSVVAKTLLAHKQPVRVLVRDEAKGAPWQALGAEVAVGSVEEEGALAAALQGAAGAYLLLPPDYGAPDAMSRARGMVDSIAGAIERSKLPHLVLLSSVGGQHAEGTGIVRTLNVAEQRFGQLGIGLTLLRAAYFMENWGSSLGQALQGGTLYSFLSPADRKIPMVATADIGAVGAWSLMLPTPARRVIELTGPEDYSPNEVAEILGRVAQKAVSAAIAPIEGMAQMLQQFGFSPDMATQMADLNVAINSGHAGFEGAGALLIRGTVPLEAVLGQMLKSGQQTA